MKGLKVVGGRGVTDCLWGIDGGSCAVWDVIDILWLPYGGTGECAGDGDVPPESGDLCCRIGDTLFKIICNLE